MLDRFDFEPIIVSISEVSDSSERDKLYATAVHESGHTIAATVFGFDVEYASIICHLNEQGVAVEGAVKIRALPSRQSELSNEEAIRRIIVYHLAGIKAEQMVDESVRPHDPANAGDMRAAVYSARYLLQPPGSDEIPVADRPALARMLEQMIERGLDDAGTLVVAQRESILSLAQLLLEVKIVNGDRIRGLMPPVDFSLRYFST